MEANEYRTLSLWFDSLPQPPRPRASLEHDEQVDVAIVGAGYTGLWTSYYLKTLQPDLRVAVLEAEVAGFGASGRNGGWCFGGLSGIEGLLAKPERRAQGLALKRAVFDAVDEVGRVCAAEGIDCHYAKGGVVLVATLPPHIEVLRKQLDFWRKVGFGEEDYRWLGAEECAGRVRTATCLGGLYSPHGAAIHPARLVRGLAQAVERRGVAIYERSPATALEPGRVTTPGGRVRADLVVRATEAYSSGLPQARRQVIPLHSMMIATEPLSEEVWREIGLAEREAFADPRRKVIYGLRTADGRIAFGGRGTYYFGASIRDRFDPGEPIFAQLHAELVSLFPMLAGVQITHRWGGVLGLPRDWRPTVGLDRAKGLAWAGGYAGEGVAASNAAGRTLADLILERDTERARLAWVVDRLPLWEPEPLRWLAIKSIWALAGSLDRSEFRTGRPASGLLSRVFKAFVRG